MKRTSRIKVLSFAAITVLIASPGLARKVVWISQDPPPHHTDMSFLEGYYRQFAGPGDTLAVGGDMNRIWCTVHSGDTFVVVGHGVTTEFEDGETIIGGGIKINGNDHSGFAPRLQEGGGTGLPGYEPYRLMPKPDTLVQVQVATCWSSHTPDDSVRAVTETFSGVISARSPHPQGADGLVRYGDVALAAGNQRNAVDSLRAILGRIARAAGFTGFGPWLAAQPYHRHQILLDSIIQANCLQLDTAYWHYSGPEGMGVNVVPNGNSPERNGRLDDSLYDDYVSEVPCALPNPVIAQSAPECLHLTPGGTAGVTFYCPPANTPVFAVSLGCGSPCGGDTCLPAAAFTRHSFRVSDSTWILRVTNLTEDDGCVCATVEAVLAVEPPRLSASASATEYDLHQNHPNPFNALTRIAFDLPQSGNARLTVYNLIGQELATVVNGFLPAGPHVVNFDAGHLSSGIYLYRLDVNGFVAAKKMLLLR